MNRTDIINHLIKKNNYKSYLEIGLDNGFNFRNIECELKESVDPYFPEDHKDNDLIFENDIPENVKDILTYRMTSDEFFAQNKKKYDIIFIDGLHLQEQVARDIVNGLKALNKGGKIVIHDCLPRTEACQIVPRQQGEWNGDVWKGVYELIQQGIDIKVIDCDYGVGIAEYCENESLLHYPQKSKMEWQDFVKNWWHMMNVVSVETFLRNLQQIN